MAAILGLDDATIAGVCESAAQDEVVSPVNYNSPGQVVIAGHAAAVERATTLAREAGAKRAVLLPVSVPSHCSLMMSAASEFATQLAQVDISSPQIPVIQNVDAAAHVDPVMIRENLGRQLYSPVQWVKSVQALGAHGVTRIIEAGPGKVLAGLCKRIDKRLAAEAVYDTAALDAALSES
jgi:[acyl-carrier-protein] S-malonyltransferase